MPSTKAQVIERQYFGWSYIAGILMCLCILSNYLVLWLHLLLVIPLSCLLGTAVYAALRKRMEFKNEVGSEQCRSFRLLPNPLAAFSAATVLCCCIGLLLTKAIWLKGLLGGAVMTCSSLWVLAHTPGYGFLHADRSGS